jgi:hypothetical protein
MPRDECLVAFSEAEADALITLGFMGLMAASFTDAVGPNQRQLGTQALARLQTAIAVEKGAGGSFAEAVEDGLDCPNCHHRTFHPERGCSRCGAWGEAITIPLRRRHPFAASGEKS